MKKLTSQSFYYKNLKQKKKKHNTQLSDFCDSENQLNVDKVIEILIEQTINSKASRQFHLAQQVIRYLCQKARQIFSIQPIMLQLDVPIKVCGINILLGDIHGQFRDLIRIFQYGGFPPQSNYLFLGDYVDRGKQSIETISLLFAYKIKYPQNFFILRGNHECSSINRLYGFYDQCKRKYNIKLWKTFSDTFNMLPVSAIIDQKILCMHGGISPQLSELDLIGKIPRPIEVPQNGLLCDLLWADPEQQIVGWRFNQERGISFTFGQDILNKFLELNDLDIICRAHQDGYQFFAKRKLVTLFSAPNYCGQFDNSAAIMSVNQNLMCSFQILKAIPQKQNSKRPKTPKNNNL